ncbi:MAG: SUMF1/EgtB/PvdO family nonheme iron enzyme, partial [Planctomycetota bacterium]
NPTLSKGYLEAIRRLTVKNPAQRYQSATEVLKDLEGLSLPPDGRKTLATFLDRRFPADTAGEGDTDRQWAREILEDAKQRLEERDFESAVSLLKKGRHTAKNPALRQTFEDQAKRTVAAEETYWKEARDALGAAARLAKQGDIEGAVTSLQEVEKKYPGTEAAREAAAKIRELRERGTDDGGYIAVRAALARSDLPGARKALEEARKRNGNATGQTSVEVGLEKEIQYLEYLERGRAQQARGKWEEGEIAFAKARALFDRKEARVGMARMRFKMFWDRARAARKRGDSKKERKFLKQAKSALEAENLSFDRKFRERLADVEKRLDLRQRLKSFLKEGKGYEAACNWSRARLAYRQALDLVSEEEKGVITRRLALVARREDAFLDNLLKRIKDGAGEGDNRRAAEMAEVYIGVRKVDPAARQLLEALSRLPDGARWRQGGDSRKIEAKWIADGARMLLVPGGEFGRGTNNGEKDEQPPSAVLVSPFLIDILPVTNKRYARFLAWLSKSPHPHRYCHPAEPPGKNHTPAHWEEERWNTPELPVVGVDWFDAFAYARWAGKQLPTEAQWEKAARGPSPRTYPWGETAPTATRCSFFDVGLGGTSPPTDRPSGASIYGVLDMAGNVLEWCLDYYDPKFYTLPGSRDGDPVSLEETPKRSLRGGSWISVAKCCRTTHRDADHPSRRNNYIGFRTVAAAPH